jgi:hypothetical protein
MKKLILTLSLLLAATTAFAGSTQLSATVDPMTSVRNPVCGTLALEQSGVRLGLTARDLGFSTRPASPLSVSLDLVKRARGGLYVGAGVVAVRAHETSFSQTTESDTVITFKQHSKGKHLGDKHKRDHKVKVSVTSNTISTAIGELNYEVSPSFFLGLAAKRGLFAESRVLFDSDEVSNRTSVGIKF